MGEQNLQRVRRHLLKHHDVGSVFRHQLDDREMAFGGEMRVVPDVECRQGQLVTVVRAGRIGISPQTGRRVEGRDGNVAPARSQLSA